MGTLPSVGTSKDDSVNVRVNFKGNFNFKGNGQECPFHMGWSRFAPRTAEAAVPTEASENCGAAEHAPLQNATLLSSFLPLQLS